ncbi:hypothetical protein NEILACOT_03694, partial [Neisseria lactamica ATCC 23970]
ALHYHKMKNVPTIRYGRGWKAGRGGRRMFFSGAGGMPGYKGSPKKIFSQCRLKRMRTAAVFFV